MKRVQILVLAAAFFAAACSDSTTTDGGTDGQTADTAPGPDLGKADTKPTPDTKAVPDTKPTPDTKPVPDTKPAPDTKPIPDSGPGGCKVNSDCKAKSMFCNLPLGCSTPGVCKVIPMSCTGQYDPVCGCNNKDYSNACVANSAGTSVKAKGKCATASSCTQIRADYTAAVAAAKKCSGILPVVQCVTVVAMDLACGCTTAVSKTNSQDYAKLLAAQAQWKAQSCDKQPWNCPKKPCKSVSTGKCSGNTCVDVP